MNNILMLHQQMMSRIIEADDPVSTETYALYEMPAQSVPIVIIQPTNDITLSSYSLVYDFKVGYDSNKYCCVGTINSSNQFVANTIVNSGVISNFGSFGGTTLYKWKSTLTSSINLTAGTKYGLATVQDKYKTGTSKIYGSDIVGLTRCGLGWNMPETKGNTCTNYASDINFKMYLEINDTPVDFINII